MQLTASLFNLQKIVRNIDVLRKHEDLQCSPVNEFSHFESCWKGKHCSRGLGLVYSSKALKATMQGGETKLPRYEKIEFLGEGQVNIDFNILLNRMSILVKLKFSSFLVCHSLQSKRYT